MDSKDIGKIIKEARLAKKMTQNEVVGTFITRNMLSQIESGTAMPSVKTLEYLCRVLDIQLEASDVTGSGASNTDKAGETYINIRKLFEAENYHEVVESICSEDFVDEVNALKARAYLLLAEKLANSDNVDENQRAVDHAQRAMKLSELGIFENEAVRDKAQQVIKAAAGRLSQYYSSLV